MKILEVITSLSSGGAERFVVDLCNQMAEDGHEITLLTLKNLNIGSNGFYLGELSSKVKHVNLGLGKFSYNTFFELTKAISRIDCNVVHFHLDAAFFGFLSYFIVKNRKYVVTCHNQAENEKKEILRLFVKRICYKMGMFDYVAISHQNAESIKKVYGKAPKKIIYNGRASMPVSCKLNAVKAEIDLMKLNAKTNVFTIVARCNPQKNIPRLIRCFNKLSDNDYNFVLLVMGNGYDSDSFSILKKTACDKIHFLGERHNVADYLSNSDFFTLSSDFEGMPITLIEALACGCIPVGTPVSGFNDVIENGKNGFVSKEISDDAYYDTLVEAIKNKDNIDREELKRLYANKFSIKSCAIQYELLYKSLL